MKTTLVSGAGDIIKKHDSHKSFDSGWRRVIYEWVAEAAGLASSLSGEIQYDRTLGQYGTDSKLTLVEAGESPALPGLGLCATFK
jgi:hypothetical protein